MSAPRPTVTSLNRDSSREEAIFADALAQPESRRAAFVEQACSSDTAMRARVIELLAAHIAAESLALPSRSSFAAIPDEKAGDIIGRYKLLQKIGEGGCGSVWMAEQAEPVRRRVALKVIRLGMDTREVIARFSAERQALAMMDHPGIAKVLDAGSTERGRPYFVMDLVRGVPITRYCDDERLDEPARIALFIQVCQAVQHAHQKGIIHRDLKPSNILVSLVETVATPKVIDFGIAKATHGRLTDTTLVTEIGQIIGTPAYMSPEQVAGSTLDIDTQTDVYSLGILLYELLVGRTPFDPRTLVNRDEIRRIIRDVEPARLSAQFATLPSETRLQVAKARNTDPAKLSLMLRGDLEWIVMRALEKNRARRYETPTALAADLTRYLNHEPVLARPPNVLYRLGKSIRRNRLAFAAATAMSLVLMAATIVSARQAVRAREAERQARAERDAANAASFAEARARAETLRQQQQAENLLSFMLGDLRVQLDSVNRLDLIESVADKAMAYVNSFEGRELNDTTLAGKMRALSLIGRVRISQNRHSDGMSALTHAFQLAAALFAKHPADGELLFERAQVEYYLGFLFRKRGDPVGAREWLTRYRDSGAELVKLNPEDRRWQRELISGRHNLAVLDLERGGLDAAREGFVAEMSMIEALAAADPADAGLQFRIADIHSWLGTVAERTGELAVADERFAAQTRILEHLVQRDTQNMRWLAKLADAQALRASLLAVSGPRELWNRAQNQAREVFDRLVPRDPDNRAWLTQSLILRLKQGMVLKADGSLEAAAAHIAAAREGFQRLRDIEPTDFKASLYGMIAWRAEAEVRLALGRPDAAEAAQHAESSGSLLIVAPSADDLVRSEYANACLVAARIAESSNHPEGARQFIQRAAAVLLPALPATDHWRILEPGARILASTGRHAEARAIIQRLDRMGFRPLEPWPALPQ